MYGLNNYTIEMEMKATKFCAVGMFYSCEGRLRSSLHSFSFCLTQ